MIKQLTIFTIMILLSLLSCGQQSSDVDIDNIKLYREKADYPYSAPEKRKNVILENMNKLEKGMTKDQVIELLTSPDEVNLTYNTVKKGNKAVGFSMVYILNRNKETGSVDEMGEKLIRIHFNNSGMLIWAYSIEIDGFSEIEKD